jgi:Glycosyl transferases group 1
MVNAPLLRIYLEPEDKIEHTASTYAGFHALAARGEVNFELIRRPRALQFLREDDGLVICGVFKTSSSLPEVRFSIDLRDRSDLISNGCLNWSQIYFKRSLVRLHQQFNGSALTPDKILPMGVNFAARSGLATTGALHVVASTAFLNPLESIGRIKRFLSLAPSHAFEQSPTEDLAPTVLFQTRLWTEKELELSKSKGLNQRRVDLVVALKNHFGPQFKGGLIENPQALATYPELISNFASDRKSYAMAAKQQLIGVYSEGLSGSTAFKFLEYLAGSQCIVAETLANQLPDHCQPGSHYLPFGTPSECIAQCERLLSNQEEARNMRHSNARFYKEVASPVARARYILEKLLALSLSPN